MLNWKVFNFLIATFIIRVRPRTESDNSTKIDIHPDTEYQAEDNRIIRE